METITQDAWLQKVAKELKSVDYEIVRQTVMFAQLVGERDSLCRGLATAEILRQLRLDSATLAAAILHSSLKHTDLKLEDVTEHLGTEITKLLRGTQQMSGIGDLYRGVLGSSNYHHNVDNIRKMFLAMVDDIRVVVIKLAEQLCILRNALDLPQEMKTQIAAETMAIYAPLANRLGIYELKWELEDLSFCYLEPDKYQEITAAIKQRFPESHQYIKEVNLSLQAMLASASIKNYQTTGRTKHIYSIHRKMSRKGTDLDNIYDVSAVRILVPTITDCYTALSLVHNIWQYIPSEFDNYIASPKSNGYRSIHTAVYGPKNRIVEIQIRTHEMHHYAELGVAAHWVYKEGKQEAHYQAKLTWLRTVMDWQQEVTQSEKNLVNLPQIFNDHIYVFTPEGDILELPQGATPIDFAYHIHSGLGHRCCGAKVNGNITPLTYILKTSDRIEILTTREGSPSRDWLIPSLGFLNTSRARSKVLHWFKKQGREDHIIQGQELYNKELKRLSLSKLNLKEAANKLNFKTDIDLLAALGSGDLKFCSLLNVLAIELEKPQTTTIATVETTSLKPSKRSYTSDFNIQGVGNLLVRIANCCRPIPGEKIIGYVTQGRGVAVHRADCIDVLHAIKLCPKRSIIVTWGTKTDKKYLAEIVVKAFDRHGLVRDVTNVLAEEELMVISLNCITDKKAHTAKINVSIEVSGLPSLGQVLHKISQLPNITDVYRRR